MPTCKKCGSAFPNYISINGKTHMLNKRSYCLECSPFGGGNTFCLDKIVDGKKVCVACGKLTALDDFYPRGGRRKGLMSECKACCSTRNLGLKHGWKKLAVAYKGGKCVTCGYSRCVKGMHFHHLNPDEKENGFGHRKGELTDSDKVELDKTVLVCCRCHVEIHDGIVEVPIV